MDPSLLTSCTAFAGGKRIASGDLPSVASTAKALIDQDAWAQVLIFDDVTSRLIEVDFRGTPEDVLQRLAVASVAAGDPEEARRPGRPKLGVVAREITLLPRHWDWLATQPGGASVAIRKLVDQARSANRSKDRQRQTQEAAYRFLSAMAGNEPGFEEACRALFAGNQERFEAMIEDWPVDVREHAKKLAAIAFEAANAPLTALR